MWLSMESKPRPIVTIRDCHVERTREWRAAHPEKIEASNARRRIEPYPPKPCAVCGETFTSIRVDQLYCTPVCKHRRRRAARQ
jgi:hypothetical protein